MFDYFEIEDYHMPVNKDSSDPRPIRKITLTGILTWGFGGLIIFGGFIQLFSTPLAGIFSILAGILIFPPAINLIKEKLRVEMSLVIRIILFFTFALISSSFLPKTPTTPAPSPSPSGTPIVQASSTPAPLVTNQPTPNADQVAGANYVNTFLNNVYPLMTSANDKVTAASTAGANYDFATAKSKIQEAIKDYNKAQVELSSIKPVPSSLTHINSLITSALGKYTDGALTVQKGLEKYNADLITQGTEIYSQGTDLITQATKEIKAYNSTITK